MRDTGKTRTRREFVRAAARYALLGAAAALAVVLVRRGGSARKCVNASLCRGCEALKGCSLPPAASAKRAMRKRLS